MSLTIRHATPQDMEAIRHLCWDYRDVLVARSSETPEIVEHYYARDDYARLLADLPKIHAKPKGAIYVAEHDARIVGCGMIHEVAPGVTEIKRLFVSDAARGLGAATAIFDAAVHDARAMGQTKLVLDTMVHLTEAMALYEKLGLTPAEPFYEPDPRFSHLIRFFGRDL